MKVSGPAEVPTLTLRCSKLCHWGFSHKSLLLQVPKTYREVYREIMTADPLVVDLHKQGPYYYEFGR